MVERVYGRMTTGALAERIRSRFEVEDAVRRLETLAQDPSRAPVHLQDGARATAAKGFV